MAKKTGSKNEKKDNKKKRRAATNGDEKVGGTGDDVMIEDDVKRGGRFDSSKPQFRRGKEWSSKVILDERFASVLTDPRFRLDARDRYGREGKKKKEKKKTKRKGGAVEEELSAFYTVRAEGDDDDDKKSPRRDGKEDGGKDDESTAWSSESEKSSDGGDVKKREKGEGEEEEEDAAVEDPRSRIAYLTALSRGEIEVSSSSSEDDEDDDDDSSRSSQDDDDDDDDGGSSSDGGGSEDPVMGKAGVLDPSTKNDVLGGGDDDADADAGLTFEASPYLAVMNMDWSHVRAADVFAIVSSFSPPGTVKRVRVYPSDFGMSRMEKEERFGPAGLWKNNGNNKKEQSRIQGDVVDEEGDGDGDSAEDGDGDEAAGRDHDDDDDAGDAGSDRSSSSGTSGDGDSDADDDRLDPPRRYGDDDDDRAAAATTTTNPGESDFDPEKLRAYEASKLRYYFAVAEFDRPEHADAAYRELDGLEFERSGAALDLRSIPTSDLDAVIKDRPMRDEALHIPGNYVPPEFVVSALQRTSVQCTWDLADQQREKTLTAFSKLGQAAAWEDQIEEDDLKAYIGSDDSDSSSSSDEEHRDQPRKRPKGTSKAANMRKLLGLDSDDDNDDDDHAAADASHQKPGISAGSDSGDGSSDDDDDEVEEEDDCDKEITFAPGKQNLRDKIRSKLRESTNDEEIRELTPWEKYQEKRKQKRREKRQATRERRREVNEIRKNRGGKAFSRNDEEEEDDDDFFVDETNGNDENNRRSPPGTTESRESERKSLAELELLVAGEGDDEMARDYDMRGLRRIEKNRDRKLRGARKRREDDLAADVAGTDFTVNVRDERFDAVLDGEDPRFGIDRTDPNFKETPSMKRILEEQGRRRRANKRRRRRGETEDGSRRDGREIPGANSESAISSRATTAATRKSPGASALSSLVSRVKSKVPRR